MECFKCRLPYEDASRRPKLLPCGHTFCFPCLERDVRCFIDNRVFPNSPSDLPDDFYLLNLLSRGEPERRRGRLRVWCETCATEATRPCLDVGHKLSSMQRHWHRQTLERLREVQSALGPPGPPGRCRAREEVPAEEPAACRGAVELTLDDGEDSWTVTVQLGGSGEESTPESWALRLLLRELDAQSRLHPEPPLLPFVELEEDDGGFGLFGLGDLEDDSEDAGEHGEDAAEVGLAVLAAEDEEQEVDLNIMTDENTNAERLSKVHSLLNVSCGSARALQLLQQVSPHLQALELSNADREHLLAAHRMPCLRRLEVRPGGPLADDRFLLPPLEHGGGLEHVRLGVSEATAASLLLAHQRTLRTVQIVLLARHRPSGLPGPPAPGPRFEELDYRGRGRIGDDVKRCPYLPRRPAGAFPALQRLQFVELVRPRKPGSLAPHQRCWPPLEALQALRAMFPGVSIDCVTECSGDMSSFTAFMRGCHSSCSDP